VGLAGVFFKLDGALNQRLEHERVHACRDGAGQETGDHRRFEDSPQRPDVRRPSHISLSMAGEAGGMPGVVDQLMNQVHVEGLGTLHQ
jgi:hypothetical protein